MQLKNITRCELCFSTDFEKLLSVVANKVNYTYSKCISCGLLFVNPMPIMSLAEMDQLNGPEWYPDLPSKFNKTDFDYYKKYAERRAMVYLKYCKPGRMLDIGCGSGYMLVFARKLGFDVTGVEVASLVSKYVKENFGINVITAELKNACFPSKYFDVINLSSVLEHLYNPLETLKEINRISKDGAILGLLIPNPQSFLNYVRNIFHCFTGRYKKSKYSIDIFPPLHLYAFPVKTLILLLKMRGFKVLRLSTVGWGDRVYRPFVLKVDLKTLLFEFIDFWGSIIGKSSCTIVYATKTKHIY